MATVAAFGRARAASGSPAALAPMASKRARASASWSNV